MASKSFNLADSPEGGGMCAKLCICTCILVFIGLVVIVGVYIYKVTIGFSCGNPELDESGLSNWTSGADHLAYACFPGYFLEHGENLLVAKCEDGMWSPAVPSCNYLPIRIDCQVNNQSLTGNITMWQESSQKSTFIQGLINYTAAIKPQGHLMEYIMISKKTCNVTHSNIPDNLTDLYPEPKDGSKFVKIQFKSTSLKAYRKAEVYLNIIFVAKNTTASLVSVHQENLTLVMAGSDPSLNSSWNWIKHPLAKGMGAFRKNK